MKIHIDPHALKAIASLQRPGKPDLLNRIVTLFKSESLKTVAALQQGLNSADLQAIHNSAHTLKSSSACIGARLLSERCRDLNSAAREANLPACIALGESVDDMFESIVEALILPVSTPV